MPRQETAASKLDSRHGHNEYLSKCGVWTGCGQRQCTPSRQQVARDETEEPLIPLSLPIRSLPLSLSLSLSLFLSLFSLQIGKVSAACSCCCTHTGRWTDWTGLGAATPVTPQGLEGSAPWCTWYKVARSKQGFTASSPFACSNTAIAELMMGSKYSSN